MRSSTGRGTRWRGADRGWFTADVQGAAAGSRYRFRIDDEVDVPDPASAFQPEDVAGPSEIVDHDAFAWRARDWRGRPWHETVLLECHVGTFSPEGTYDGLIGKLDHIAQTGITAIELMPVGDFPGKRNWGYDGVLWYAPDHTYGSPDDLKRLIDEAHLRGIMVFLDVVYNHFGPEGNYLGRYAPQFFKNASTPWGSAIDYAVPEVKAFAIENALFWLRDYRFDGLRLDAVHAIAEPDRSALLQELSNAVGSLARESGRHIHLVLENDDNCASVLDADTAIPAGRYRAQWNDDYHHAWHVLLTGETHGYYSDYARNPGKMIARTLASGFAYQGEPSEHRGGRPRGEPVGNTSPAAFVNFLQNHDQIGNRALGDRLEWSANPEAIDAALAITLLAPMPPMLFMGEEWGARTPFPFFCDFDGELAEAIRQGAPQRVRGSLRDLWRRRARSARRVDIQDGEAGLGGARRRRQRSVQAGQGAACRSQGGDHAEARRRVLRPCRASARQHPERAMEASRRRLAGADRQSLRTVTRRAVMRCCTVARSGADRRRNGCRPGRCSGRSEMPDAGRLRHVPPAAHEGFRLRAGRRRRAVSEVARHHSCLCVALHAGAQRQHPRL